MWSNTMDQSHFHSCDLSASSVGFRYTVWQRGFCSGLLMVHITVGLWHNNTQLCLQAAHSVHSESLCCWKCLTRYWTCFWRNPCRMNPLYISSQSTPALSLQVVWSMLSNSYQENMRPDRWWSVVDLAGQSGRLAESVSHCSHLSKRETFSNKCNCLCRI